MISRTNINGHCGFSCDRRIVYSSFANTVNTISSPQRIEMIRNFRSGSLQLKNLGMHVLCISKSGWRLSGPMWDAKT